VAAAPAETPGRCSGGFVSLRQRPQVSSRMIAANRANAQKSTGPRRKARVTLNALKHDATTGCTVRFAMTSAPWASLNGRRPNGWRRRLGVLAGGCGGRVCGSGQRPPTRSWVWCLLRVPTSRGGSGTKPIHAMKSTDSRITFPLRIRIEISKTGIRLQLWVRSRRMVWPRLGQADFPSPLEGRVST